MMSRIITSNSFTSPSADSAGDEPPFISTLNIDTSTLNVTHNIHQPFPLDVLHSGTSGYQYDPVPNVEIPLMGHPGHANEYSLGADLTGPYSAMNHLNPNYPLPASWSSNMEDDFQPHLITDLPEHGGNQTHHGIHVPIAPRPPQLDFYALVDPDLTNDDPLGHASHPHGVAGHSRQYPSPMHSAMSYSDNEDLKRRASHYLNNSGSYVDELRVWDRRSGGRRVLILLEIDDTM